MDQPPQQPQDEPYRPQSEQFAYGPQPQPQPQQPQQYAYGQQPQPQPQQFAYGPPQRPVKKNRTMKILAIVFVSVGLALAVLSTIPTYGIAFGVIGFACDALTLLFVCLI